MKEEVSGTHECIDIMFSNVGCLILVIAWVISYGFFYGFFIALKVQVLSMLYRHEHDTTSLCSYILVHISEITYKAFTIRLYMITMAVVQVTCFINTNANSRILFTIFYYYSEYLWCIFKSVLCSVFFMVFKCMCVSV